MNEFIQNFQPTSELLSRFLPEMLLAAVAMLVLALDVILPKDRMKIGTTVASVGLLSAAYLLTFVVPGESPLMRILGIFAAFFPICAFLAVHLAETVGERTEFQRPITNHLFLIATAAAMALMKVENLVAFFVLLETVTISLYALVGSYRKSAFSLEAGVKYLIAGGVSGGLMLFGIVLLYGAVSLAGVPGNPLDYTSVATFFAMTHGTPLGLVGAGMVLAGVMFKLGIFPMQFWIPDVYQGAPLHVTFFLGTLSKSVGFFLMVIFLAFVFSPAFSQLFPILVALTLVSIVYANVAALGQQKVKRLLGLSGVSHAGYLMLGLLAALRLCTEFKDPLYYIVSALILLLYLAFYIASLYPICSVMARVPAQAEALQDFDDFRGLAKRSPVLAAALASGLGSLAGIPPTVGFIAKLGILWIVFRAGLYVPAAVMLACVVASVYYYFGWIRAAFSTDSDDLAKGAASGTLLLPGIFSRGVLVFFTALSVLGCVVYFSILGIVS